jgi:hypothetical protein
MDFSGFRLLNLVWLLFLLASCNNNLSCVDKPKLKSEPLKDLEIQVGIQGSNSMSGFVSSPATRYATVLEKLDVILSTSTKNLKFWRLGKNPDEKVTGATRINSLSQAVDRYFYDCNQPEKYFYHFSCVTSPLEQIYDLQSQDKGEQKSKNSSENNSMTILVTNLENDDGDIKGLVSRISRLNSTSGYSTFLLGVRSEYNGKIYPLRHNSTPNVENYPNYTTKESQVDQKGRPFYIVMSGPTYALQEILRQLRQQLPSSISQVLRVSSFGGSEVVTLDKNTLHLPDSCLSLTGAIKGSRPFRNQDDQWLLLEDSCSEKNNIVLEIPSENSAMVTGASINPNMFATSNPAVKVQDVKVDGDRIILKTGVDLQNIYTDREKALYITLKQRTLDDALWQDWSTNNSFFDGSKTRNLALFVSGLRESVESETKNKDVAEDAVKFCLGFNRNK